MISGPQQMSGHPIVILHHSGGQRRITFILGPPTHETQAPMAHCASASPDSARARTSSNDSADGSDSDSVIATWIRADPTAGGQGVQCESLRLTRVRGEPRASEVLGSLVPSDNERE